MARKTVADWTDWYDCPFSKGCLPGFLKQGRRFHVGEVSTLSLGSMKIRRWWELAELRPVYGRRAKGEGNKPRPRIKWEWRKVHEEFQSEESARKALDAMLSK